jgi:hypothetical protein
MDFQNLTLKSQSLQGVLRLVERGSPKYVKATLRSLRRYLGEGSPPLQRFAALAADVGVATRVTSASSGNQARSSPLQLERGAQEAPAASPKAGRLAATPKMM